VRAALARRGSEEAETVDRLLELDERWRAATAAAEALRAEQKAASERIAAGKRAGEDVSGQIARMREVSQEVKERTEQARESQAALEALLVTLPNLPEAEAPDEDAEVRASGEPATPADPPRDHLELSGPLIDMESAGRVSGARFAYLKGALVMLELALVRYAMEKLTEEGFEPVIPPVLVREEALFGTGFLPDTEQQIYRLADDDLFLIGTSEVPLASLHAGELLDEAELPRRYAGFSPCFRREAGAAGRDTRGIFRVHQFDKVEMFSFVAPDEARAEHERILRIEEEILQELEVPYRVVDIAVAELGASAARKFDLEAWLPGQARFRELTSCSNTTDFQARRLDVRFRPAQGGRPRHVATLNGTAVAVGRTIIALLENGQRPDGSVELPEALVAVGAPARIAPAEA